MVVFQSCWLFLVRELNFRCTLETKKGADTIGLACICFFQSTETISSLLGLSPPSKLVISQIPSSMLCVERGRRSNNELWFVTSSSSNSSLWSLL